MHDVFMIYAIFYIKDKNSANRNHFIVSVIGNAVAGHSVRFPSELGGLFPPIL